jgi:hypothetical protein
VFDVLTGANCMMHVLLGPADPPHSMTAAAVSMSAEQCRLVQLLQQHEHIKGVIEG